MYILLCANNRYYTGSTVKALEKRVAEHQRGEGANFTKKHLPVKLVYFEKFQRKDEAFKREKQIQRWSHKKKEALINGNTDQLIEGAKKKFDLENRNLSYLCREGKSQASSNSIQKRWKLKVGKT